MADDVSGSWLSKVTIRDASPSKQMPWWVRARRKAWMKLTLRDVSGCDNHPQLDRIYALQDPWGMETERERARFSATNAIIESAFGPVDSLLEIGCGEGHQTEFLAQVSAQQFGLDVSARAISLACERMPRAQFHVGDLFDQPWGDQQHRFDLITACDVLYYMSDIPAALARMRHLARAGLVTFYAPASARVAPYLGVIEGVRHDWIFHGNTVWLVAWWRDGDG